MKAFEILMFLLIFNLVLWLLGGYGLNIYQLGSGYATDINTDVLEDQTLDGTTDIGTAFLIDMVGIIMATIIFSAATYATIGYLLRAQPSPQFVVYSMFGGLFWTSYIKTIQVFYNIALDVPEIFLTIFLVFTAITVYVFIFGFSQIITQSWRYMR